MLTARHWNSKELFATAYWTLIGPRFLDRKCQSLPPTVFRIDNVLMHFEGGGLAERPNRYDHERGRVTENLALDDLAGSECRQRIALRFHEVYADSAVVGS